jgi:hypothetical protein
VRSHPKPRFYVATGVVRLPRELFRAHQKSVIIVPPFGTQPLEISMFKQVVPVLSLILLAGPVFAADTPPADTSAAASTTKSTKKHHAKKHHKAAASSDSSAPK